MRKGWELIGQSGPGGTWNTISRDYGPLAYEAYTQWMATNEKSYRYNLSLRPVTEADAPLAAGYLEEESNMADRNSTAKDDGLIFASRLGEMMRNPNSIDSAVLLGVARVFAKFSGYTDADGAFAYIEGFMQGFGSHKNNQITAPANTVDSGD